MKKYLSATKTEWLRISTYRISMLSFRIGDFLEIFIQILIWSVIFKTTEMVYGYSYNEMISYIIIGYLFAFLIANYEYETNIARAIQDGRLSSLLCKPINLLGYIISISFGRIYTTIFSSLFLQIALIIYFHNLIILQKNIFVLILVVTMLLTGYFIKLFLSILIGMIAFWTNSISGFQFSAKVFINFFSGAYFTLALLPAGILKVAMALPFAYTFFVPTQIYLGKMSLAQGVKGLVVSLIWLIVLFVIIKIIWNRGLKKYESVGI